IAFLLLVLVLGCSRVPTPPVLALTGATVINPADGSRITGPVLIQNGLISAVGSDGAVQIPSDAKIVDARGKYVIPGLWDMHVHIRNQQELDLFFPLLIAHGILGIRDCEGLSPSEFRNLAQRQEYAPRIFASGPAIDGLTPDGVADPAADVDARAIQGVDFIKVFSMLPRGRFLAIADRARKHGLGIAGHVPLAMNAGEASDAGMQTMEHLFEIH